VRDERKITSITWTHDGDTVTCTVGQPIRREVPRRVRGKRDYSVALRKANDGGVILSIEDHGGYYLVFYEGRTIWENPFMAGKPATSQVVYATDGQHIQ